jgi:hypothetical protein
MCLAARITNAMRDRAKKNDRGNVNGLYDAIHIQSKLFFCITRVQFALLLNLTSFSFNLFGIPGGDFRQQYPSTEMNASEILTGLKEFITPGVSVFIATNERDLSFFASIQEVYDVSFIGDFGHIVSGVSKYFMFRIIPLNLQNSIVFYQLFLVPCSCHHCADPNYFPLAEQIVASRGRIFIGTFLSTFSAYIARLRGYYG